jgi:hypothetical protein
VLGEVSGTTVSGSSTTFTRSEAEELFLTLVRQAQLPQPLVNVRRHGYAIDSWGQLQDEPLAVIARLAADLSAARIGGR